MQQLKDEIGKSISSFDSTCTDLEVELSKDKYETDLPEIRRIIRKSVCEADIKAKEMLLKDSADFEGIRRLTCFCYDTHPKVMNVVSTNYDRILEYVWGSELLIWTLARGFTVLGTYIWDLSVLERSSGRNCKWL